MEGIFFGTWMERGHLDGLGECVGVGPDAAPDPDHVIWGATIRSLEKSLAREVRQEKERGRPGAGLVQRTWRAQRVTRPDPEPLVNGSAYKPSPYLPGGSQLGGITMAVKRPIDLRPAGSHA